MQKLHFLLDKIIDYKNRTAELEESIILIAILVLIHLKSLEVKNASNEDEFDIKLNLHRMLYRKGYPVKDMVRITGLKMAEVDALMRKLELADR